MSKWIKGNDLVEQWGIKTFELFEYITHGLQPHDEYGRPISSPDVLRKLNFLKDQEEKLKELLMYQNVMSSDSYIKDEMERHEKAMALLAVPREGKIPGNISKPSIADIENRKKRNENTINKITEIIDNTKEELSKIDDKASWANHELPESKDDIQKVFDTISNYYFLRSDVAKFIEPSDAENTKDAPEGGLTVDNFDSDTQMGIDLKEASDQKEETDECDVPSFGFYRNGQKWMIGEKGKEVIFDHLIGFECIRFLIRYEEEHFNPLQVHHLGNVPDDIRHLLYEITYHKYGDPETITTIRKHKDKLEAKYVLETDPQILQELEYKIDQDDRYLKQAKNGFPRRMNSYGTNVRKNIKRAVTTIIKQSREYPTLKPLEKLLCLDNPDKRIKTGNPCWYRPDFDNPVEWKLDR